MSIEQLHSQFVEIYKHQPQGHVSAPGRVNLIGEFTDYNNGFVLPAALNFRTHVMYSLREDEQCHIASLNYPDEKEQFNLNEEITHGDSQWGNYIRAVVFVLNRAGYKFSGFNLLISSDVPQGAGLSSSAALEVSVTGAINKAFNLGITKQNIALFGQQAENDFMDCQCGIMDQLISAKGKHSSALLIDCDNLETKSFSIPDDLSIVIVDSNYKRKLVDSEYNQRRVDCEQAAHKMNVDNLRHASLELLLKTQSKLTDNEFKRARHVITENRRVINATHALEQNDMQQLKDLMAASHDSLRDDFEVTVPATDGLVNICKEALDGRGAVRMTGGGFGGAIICLCRKEDIDIVVKAIDKNYFSQFNLEASIYICTAEHGFQEH